ncbi:hypothetical protein ACIP98_28955 [Streptomyces sp. NPDC088354]|uniref:hypothetical protein n=1 Tax=Streptomyces sp. NPDC088354 TaxID=3365856 RepID=UPI0038292E32
MGLDFTGLQRIPEEQLVSKDIRYLALVQVDLIALYRRWGRPDVAVDDLAEWLCFAFSLPGGDKFALQREALYSRTSGFLLSVSRGLFSAEAGERLIGALEIPGVSVVEWSAEVGK